MSSDNGWVLRRNARNRFVVQEYSASADGYPPIDDIQAVFFGDLGTAIAWCEINCTNSEYGLTIKVANVTETNDG